MCALSSLDNIFLGFSSGTTSADLLMTSMAAEPFLIRLLFPPVVGLKPKQEYEGKFFTTFLLVYVNLPANKVAVEEYSGFNACVVFIISNN